MRLLVLSLMFPVPADNGHKMRIWTLLRALAAEGHELTLLSFIPANEVGDAIGVVRTVCQHVEVVPMKLPSLSSPNNFAGRVLTLPTALPYAAARFRSEAMRLRLIAQLMSSQPDTVLCETPYTLVNVPPFLPVPLIVDMHNIEHVLLERYLACEGNPLRRACAWVECQKLKRWERRSCSRARLALVCSEYDRSQLAGFLPALATAVVPNALDLSGYSPTPDDDRSTILYLGGMDWFPNRDAVEFFVFKILPAVRELVPDVEFVVAGRGPTESFRRKFECIPRVRFTGTVPDLREEIARATVCVVPLRIGSGTRLKILEAAAMAKPIVSTRIGAEGLKFADGKEIILVDEPQAFAKGVSRLLADKPRRRELGQAALRRVEQDYSFPALRQAVRQALGHFAQSPQPEFSELHECATIREVAR